MVKIGEFDYRVVNGAKYNSLRNEEERREQNRINKQKERERKKTRKIPKPLSREPESKDEHAFERNFKNGIVDKHNQIIREDSPEI